MALKLVMMRGEMPFALDLPDGQYVIGRDSTAAIVIDHPSLSGHHAELSVAGNLAKIRDLGSVNGTWVNGIRLADRNPRIVTEVDRIRLGDVHFAIELVGAEAQGTRPAFAGQVVIGPEAKHEVEEEEGGIPTFMTFKGRLGRGEYWGASILLLLAAACMVVWVLSSGRRATSCMASLVILAVWLFFVWLGLCATAKRWHDRDRSAWWLLLPFSPLPLQIAASVGFGNRSPAALFAGIIGIPIIIWNLVELYFVPGTQGPNRYGR